MQTITIVNVSPVDAGQSRVGGRVSTPLRPFGRLMPILLPALLVCILVSVARGQSSAQTPLSRPTQAAAQSDAQQAFKKMKTLAGSWQGTVAGIPIDFTIRAASSDTAILLEGNTAGGRPPNHEITMVYLDGDRLLATHYCDAGNRARLEGKMSPDGKTFEFSFLDVAGSTKGGYVKGMAFTMIDADHHTVELTFVMPDGKPVQVRGEFQRNK